MLALSARLRQRAAHAFAGRAGWLAEVLVASKMPSGNPRRGFPAKSLPQEAFSTLLRLPKATKAVGRCLALCKPFEKGLSENFTCLHPTQARAFQLASLSQLRRL